MTDIVKELIADA
jgi:hypothetical protein